MPSALKAQLVEDMKSAMRAHETLRLGVIRFILSELKNFEIDNGEQDDAGVLKVISREVKKVKDALVDFQRAGRQDLIDDETAKIAIMETYLPQQMSDADLQAVVQKVVAASAEKNFGLVMKAVMAEVGSGADGGRVSAAVKAALA
jgi:uncharacterized protein YqeY